MVIPRCHVVSKSDVKHQNRRRTTSKTEEAAQPKAARHARGRSQLSRAARERSSADAMHPPQPVRLAPTEIVHPPTTSQPQQQLAQTSKRISSGECCISWRAEWADVPWIRQPPPTRPGDTCSRMRSFVGRGGPAGAATITVVQSLNHLNAGSHLPIRGSVSTTAALSQSDHPPPSGVRRRWCFPTATW